MSKPSDSRGKPGDIVLVRGTHHVVSWGELGQAGGNPDSVRNGMIPPGALGLIVSIDMPGFTYVLWSVPSVAGWVLDGYLRPV